MRATSTSVIPSSLVPNDSSPGRLPQNAYNTVLPRWRVAVRNVVLSAVERESRILARMQGRFKTPWLDVYFLYSSCLGTHTFFMIALPILFFFGYDELGRGLVFVLASGVYVSSFVKDLVCAPRPFSPPVTRLIMGTHHLEYGFPSTHSTNSVSMALFIYGHIYYAYSVQLAISDFSYYAACLLLLIYVISIVFGRLYTGMHSFVDCTVGVVLGAGVWGFHVLMHDTMESWLESGSWIVPWIAVPLCLLLVHFHPQPIDDCPCFEDAIAFISVILGVSLARWHIVSVGMDDHLLRSIMPGSQGHGWTIGESWRWCSLAGAKIGLGILIIFVWRLLAKFVLHLALPPLFRALAHCFELPRRRFYTPATDYAHVPAENGLYPIPSVIDLPDTLEVSGVCGEHTKSEIKRRTHAGIAKARLSKGTSTDTDHFFNQEGELEGTKSTVGTEVKHYDADVLTKVVVYAGIAFLSAEAIPVLFSIIGWGIHPW